MGMTIMSTVATAGCGQGPVMMRPSQKKRFRPSHTSNVRRWYQLSPVLASFDGADRERRTEDVDGAAMTTLARSILRPSIGVQRARERTRHWAHSGLHTGCPYVVVLDSIQNRIQTLPLLTRGVADTTTNTLFDDDSAHLRPALDEYTHMYKRDCASGVRSSARARVYVTAVHHVRRPR